MPPVALHARPATGLIDTGIVVLRRRYWDLFLAELIPASPVLLVAVFVPSAAIRSVRVALLLAYPVATGIAACLVSQEFTGRAVSLGDAVRRTLRRAPGLIGVSLVASLLTLLGVIGLIVGGFVVAAWMYTAIPVYAVEEVSAAEAIDRAMALARGNVLHVLGVLFGGWLGFVIMDYIAVLAINWAWMAMAQHVSVPVRVDTLAAMIAGLAIAPFPHVLPAVVYYDLRIRREGMDIEAMAAALDAPAMPNAPEANPA